MSDIAVTSRFADRGRDERLTGNVLPPPGTTAGFVLTAQADGTSAWQAGGSSGALLQLFDLTLGADAATIDTGAGGVAGTANHLLVIMYLRTSEAAVISGVSVTLNGDTGNNYDRQTLRGANVTASAVATAAQPNWGLPCPGNTAAASSFGNQELWIPAYTQTTGHKSATATGGQAEATAANNRAELSTLRWRNTAAVTQVTITANGGSNLKAGSRMSVYGYV